MGRVNLELDPEGQVGCGPIEGQRVQAGVGTEQSGGRRHREP